jgi:hypothetical protein
MVLLGGSRKIFAAQREPYTALEKTSNGFLRWNFPVRKVCPGLKKGIAAP